jgi:hypothetical protein
LVQLQDAGAAIDDRIGGHKPAGRRRWHSDGLAADPNAQQVGMVVLLVDNGDVGEGAGIEIGTFGPAAEDEQIMVHGIGGGIAVH